MEQRILLVLVILLLVACTPSPQAIQTAIAQTQIANPTSTFTPPPTNTPTETPTIIPSPTATLDLLLIQFNLKDFLLKKSDLPQDSHYAKYVMGVNSLYIIPNDSIKIANSVSYLKESGRIEGWTVYYGVYSSNFGWLELLVDEVTLFQTSAGAQLSISKYSQAVANQLTEEINPPVIGDFTRAFYNSSNSYEIDFSYRNITHKLAGYNAGNVIIDNRNIALNLLARLQASPLLNP
jgi:hypothetical protein